MNFLGALGGIGKGVTAGVKDWRDADEEKRKQQENALRIQAIQQGISKAQRESDDAEALRKGGSELQTKLDNSGKVVNDFTGEVGKNFSLSDYHDQLAGVYRKQGNHAEADRETKMAKFTREEGFSDGIKMLRQGVPVEDVAKHFNSQGSLRMGNGELKAYDPKTDTATIVGANGVEVQYNLGEIDKRLMGLKDQAALGKTVAETSKLVAETNTAIPANAAKDLADAAAKPIEAKSNAAYHAGMLGVAKQNAAGGVGSGDASKGAKYDIDGEGNRVILYRDGTMVYPKDSSGNPVKIKAGTDADQKFVRQLILGGEKNRFPGGNEDFVARAQALAQRTGGATPQKAVPRLRFDANGNPVK